MKNEFRNWSDLSVFLAVFREGSTLAASRKLGVAQPTVARRIDALEHETGLTLFVRDTRGFKPTEHARALYSRAEKVEESITNFAVKAGELRKPGPVRITASGHFADRTMEIISAFAAANPAIELEFVHSIRNLDLIVGEADVAFRVSASEPDERLIRRKIGTVQFALFGSKPYAEQFGLPKSLDELRGHRFLSFKNETAADYLHKWLLGHVSQDQIMKTFSDIDQMYAAIKSGLGLGLIHVNWADTDAAFIRCSGNIDEVSRPMDMLIAPEAHRRPEVRAFTKFFAPRYAATFK